jgi:flagellar hook-associated protein 3 FlgL
MISTLSLMTSQLVPVAQVQAALSAAETETATGQYADLGLQLGAQSGQELSLKNQNGLLQSYADVNPVVSTRLSVASSALTSILSGAQTALSDLTTWSSSGGAGSTLQSMGQNGLSSLIASANTTAGGQYVFSGVNSGAQPLADFYGATGSAAKTAIDQAFQAQFGVSPTDPAAADISASDLQGFLNGAFASQFQGSSWSSNWSSASDTRTTTEIAPGQSVTDPATANNSGLQSLAQAYAMLSEFGGSALSAQAQQVVASTASSLIGQGVTSVTTAEASIGSAQAQVTDTGDQIAAQQTLLQTQIGALDGINESSIATQVSSLQTQLQASYAVTARLQQMSLAQYLPVA